MLDGHVLAEKSGLKDWFIGCIHLFETGFILYRELVWMYFTVKI